MLKLRNLQFDIVGLSLKRFAATALIVALLAPSLLLYPSRQASASILPQTPAIVSDPPMAFSVGSAPGFTSTLLSNFGSFFSNTGQAISKALGRRQVPVGLEQPETELTPTSAIAEPNSNESMFFVLPPGSVRYDFDGDGKADIGRWHNSNTEWKVKNSGSGTFTSTTIGTSSSIITPGDFDGDGKTDPAVFSAGTWTIKQSSTNQTITVSFGTAGDKPVVGDYDGDNKADCAVFRPSTNTWWILQSGNGATTSTSFGAAGDITAQGNYDGDNKTDIAVFRPSTGDWHISGSTSGYFAYHWGIASDIPVPGDYDGDGKTDFAVFRGTTGTWYAAKSSTGNAQYIAQSWGNYGDQPVPADYDGDGKDDIAVWRPTTGIWYIIKSSNGSFDYPGLGVAGDTAITSAYLKQIGGYLYSYDFAKVRLSPKNATGGTNLYSQNFSWGTSLVGLPGRAGLDAGFGISYNSLVWTKDAANDSIVFNADNSNLTPGFRFGFPTIEAPYFDGQTGKFSYLMVGPSGGRVEFRQTAASGVYETADSSYTQLKINGSDSPNTPAETLSLTVTTTDGTQSLYEWRNGAYRCQKITDRNGNYITINHDANGVLQSMTDTLGRVITVNYGTDGLPASITQIWKDNNGTGSNVTRTYATFTYTTQAITTNFNNLSVIGPGNGYELKVLQKITFPTESTGAGPNTVFTYNTYGQVTKITNYAADNHELNYTKVNLPADATATQTDCPRFTETRSKIENFNLDQNGTAQETLVTNTITENESYNVGGYSGTTTKIEVAMANHPHGAVSKTFVGNSGWMEGLPIITEDWANGANGLERKRWTWTQWTQDNTSLSYILNPRTTESKVGDTTNTKRTRTFYKILSGTIADNGLIERAEVLDGDTVLKAVETDYNLSSAYTSRRIVGLPSETRVFGREGGNLSLVTKMTYNYDQGDFSDSSLLQNPSNVVQHDNTNFSAALTTGRGNPTSTTRHDVSGQTASVTSSAKYNTTGAVVAQISPWTSTTTRTVKLDYADSFTDGVNRNTFAYPTKIYDPAANFSEVKYRFDDGANVEAVSPAPAGNTIGKQTKREFDNIGRLIKDKIVNTGAYVRYEYPANMIQSKSFSTIVDTNNNGADTADEVYSESWSDGAGRTLRSRTEHPGSAGGWSGSLAEYNILGQVKRASVPTEINSNYEPAGDDYVRGWLWNQQEYDWKGRVVRSIPSDSTGNDGKDQLISYEGCGCAGGQVTTVQSEVVPKDTNPNETARRTQKIYEDVLGRAFKTEVMEWDGTTVYKTTKSIFNGRDQVTEAKEFQGNDTSPTFQTTTATFDGHGRLKTSHRPEQQNADRSAAYTVYNHNPDDSVQSVIDARGVVTSYAYNDRNQVTAIDFTRPAGPNYNLPAAPGVTFAYDSLGNRTSMTDGLGTKTYQYDSLSRLTSETRNLTDFVDNPFTIAYTYNLSGGLKSYTVPGASSFQVNYTHDKGGRLSVVSGTASTGSTTYASNPQYRAWGALEHLEYGNGTKFDIPTFNNKLQATSLDLKDANNVSFIKKQYQFYNDGSLKYTQDELDSKYDRSFKYDHLSRTTEAKTGAEARGLTDSAANIPYYQKFSYDVFGNTTQTQGRNYTSPVNTTNMSYVNNRRDFSTEFPNGDDQEGNPRYSDGAFGYHIYNAAGQLDSIDMETGGNIGIINQSMRYDGDGYLVKKTAIERLGNETLQTESTYDIRSSMLGGEIIYSTGPSVGQKGYVRANGTVIATRYQSQYEYSLYWSHKDLSMSSVRTSNSSGAMITTNDDGNEFGKLELDPQGNNVGYTDWWAISQQGTPDPIPESGFEPIQTIRNGQPVRHNVDGIDVPASHFGRMLEFAFGGIFGLIERQAQLSRGTLIGSNYSYADARGRTWRGLDRRTAHLMQRESHGQITEQRFWAVSDTSWAMNFIVLNRTQDCKPGTPCPKPRPTPTPQPKPTPPPYPNCYTIYQLIFEHDAVKDAISGVWKNTFALAKEVERDRSTLTGRYKDRSQGGEYGGWFFFNPKEYKIQFFAWANHGEPPQSGKTATYEAYYDDRKAAIAKAAAEGYTILVLDIHSHPPDDITGNGIDETDYDKDNSPSGPDLFGGASWSSNTFGIVVYGNGKFRVFHKDKDDTETLKRTCLKSLGQ